MADIVLRDDELRDVHRLSASLYKSLSAIVEGLESPDKIWTTEKQSSFDVEPWLYYRLMVGDKSIHIHRHRNGLYSLEVCGFTPRFCSPYKAKHGRYRNFFGSFETLQDCFVVFARESYQVLLDIAGVLF